MSDRDASFAEGAEQALTLRAETPEDLPVISALVQDAVLSVEDIRYERKERRLALLLNRFRNEDADNARREHRPFERVRSLLVISDVGRVQAQGIGPKDKDLVISILALNWQPGPDGTGRLELELAGDGAIAADVECISVDLRDVTQPYIAPSGKAPNHDDA
ncbi:DUF2948 family protein [Paracoccus pacificus]|uniref:DUF2948 family protein n=1 Tax=Paracoccus pacificus TaxID=1463598 RepID=A0ABW4RBL2_9RHOB